MFVQCGSSLFKHDKQDNRHLLLILSELDGDLSITIIKNLKKHWQEHLSAFIFNSKLIPTYNDFVNSNRYHLFEAPFEFFVVV